MDFLYRDPLNSKEIARLIESALKMNHSESTLRNSTPAFINKNYNRAILRPQIVALYHHIYTNHNS